MCGTFSTSFPITRYVAICGLATRPDVWYAYVAERTPALAGAGRICSTPRDPSKPRQHRDRTGRMSTIANERDASRPGQVFQPSFLDPSAIAQPGG